jgi:predicted RNase H-like HicB family nuclease
MVTRTACRIVKYWHPLKFQQSHFSAYVPDLPGCVATGATVEEVEREIRDAIAFHLEGMREDGLPIPVPTSKVEYIELAA